MMVQEIKIKKLDARDVTEYGEIIERFIYESVRYAAHEETYEMEDAKKKCLELRDDLKAEKAFAFGVISESKLLGFLWAYEYPFRSDKSRIYVSILHVDEAYRRRSYGTQLLNALENEAIECGITSVYLHTEASNEGAVRFCNRMGYQTERIQLVKMNSYFKGEKNEQCNPGYKRLTSKMLVANQERFIELFLMNAKAHIFMENFGREWAAEKVSDLEQYLLDNKAIVFGYFAGNVLEGFIWGFPFEYQSKKRYLINAVVVSLEYRRKHIAEELFQSMEDVLEGTGVVLYTHVDKMNEAAHQFYLKCGMKEENYQMVKTLM